MLLVDEPGTRRLFVNDMRGPLYTFSSDGKTVTLYLDINDPKWGVNVQSQGNERGFQSFAFHPQFSRPGHARLRQVLHLHRHGEHAAGRRLQAERRHAHARHGAARVDREEPGRGGLRRRRAARADAVRAAVRQPQRRPAALQSARRAEQRRLRSALHGHRRWRQRRRSAQQRAEPQLGVRQDPAHRSARHQQRQRQVRHPDSNPFVNDNDPDTLGEIYAVRRAQSAALRVGLAKRQHVRRRHRPEHRRGGQPGDQGREPRLEQLGRQLPLHQPARRSASRTRAAIRR